MEKNRAQKIGTFIISFLLFFISLAEATTSIRISPKSVNMGTIGVLDYENQYKEKTRANIVVVTDTVNAWKLMVKTNNNNMGVVGDYAKPISDFLWRATGSYATQTTYIGITNYDVEAARGAKGTNLIIYIDAKILLSWARDIPGKYSIIVTYTLTTQ